MSRETSSILIYGICETPSILWDAHKNNPNNIGINRQYICLDDELLTLRIGSRGWLEVKSEQLLQFQSDRDLNTFTKEMLFSKVNAFNKPIKNALISYFAWAEHECLKISESELSNNLDPLFAKADQLFFSVFLPLPHPKIVVTDEEEKFIGVANFDLGFCINGKVYLLAFSGDQFIRKTESNFRKKLFNNTSRFIFADLPKPKYQDKFDKMFVDHLLHTIPSLKNFVNHSALPHGIYYAKGLEN